MQTGVLTILGVEQSSGVSQSNGKPWTRFDIKASDGNKYSTFQAPLAQQAGQTNGQPVTLEYEARVNGQYTNYDLKAVFPANGAVPNTPAPQAPAHAVAQVNGNPPKIAQTTLGEPSTFQQDKDAKIGRASAAKTAFTYAAAAGLGTDEAFNLAFQLEEYLDKGRVVAPNLEEQYAANALTPSADDIPWS